MFVVIVVQTALIVVFDVVVVETCYYNLLDMAAISKLHFPSLALVVVFVVDKLFQIDSCHCQCHYQYLALIFLHHYDYYHVFFVLASFRFEIWVSTLQ